MSALVALLTLLSLNIPSALFQAIAQTPGPPTLTFTDLKRGDVGSAPFKIDGFVIDIYKCPPCPPRAMCKPCIPDNVVATDDLEEKDPSEIRRLRIYTDKTAQFELKKKYLFTVKTKGNSLPGRAITEVELVSFEPVKE